MKPVCPQTLVILLNFRNKKRRSHLRLKQNKDKRSIEFKIIPVRGDCKYRWLLCCMSLCIAYQILLDSM